MGGAKKRGLKRLGFLHQNEAKFFLGIPSTFGYRSSHSWMDLESGAVRGAPELKSSSLWVIELSGSISAAKLLG